MVLLGQRLWTFYKSHDISDAEDDRWEIKFCYYFIGFDLELLPSSYHPHIKNSVWAKRVLAHLVMVNSLYVKLINRYM